MLKFLLKSAIWAVEQSLNTPERKGARGERKVHNALAAVLDGTEYKVFSDLIIPADGGTSQIDHLIISRFGIFVIETKNMSGWIFGGADQPKWTQVQKGGKRLSFQNPIFQNYAHLRSLEAIFRVKKEILHNFVVFTGSAEPKTEMPFNVAWGLEDLGRLIGKNRTEVLSETDVQNCVNTLQQKALENTKAVRKEHLNNIQKNAAKKVKNPPEMFTPTDDGRSCPKCGAEMIKRVNRKTHEFFWGCTRFPKCKFTQKAP